jgi:hypothetical protein
VVVDPVLRSRTRRRAPEEARHVRLVLAEEHRRVALGDDLDGSEERVLGHDSLSAVGAEFGLRLVRNSPGPGVAIPGGGEQVQRFGLRACVRHGDRHEHVVRVGLRVVDLDYPVAIVVEDARVEELVLGIGLAAAAVLGDQVRVRELALRIVVSPAIPRVAG